MPTSTAARGGTNRRLQWLLILALLTVAGVALLRWLSRRQTLPCPSWLSLLLENPYMNRVAGATTLVARLDVAPGMAVLDAGCGPGRLTVPLARAVGPAGGVTALDIQPAMLKRARTAVAAAGLENVRFIQAGLGAGALPEAAYDRALLVTVLGEIPDRLAALTEIRRALKPGGVLSITEVLPDPHFQTRRTVARLADAAGFAPGPLWHSGPGYTAHLIRPADG